MKTTALSRFAWMLFLLGLFTSVHAEDTDIYSENVSNTGVPNVLLVLDNAASFSASVASPCTYVDGTSPSLGRTAGGIEQCAIYNVVSSLPAGAINLGLMIYNANNITDWQGANCGGSQGGCLAVPLTLMSGQAKTDFLAWVKSWKDSSAGPGTYWIKTSNQANGATMQEVWAYYAGQIGLSGRNYASIQPPAGCQKNFVIYVGNAYLTNTTPGDGVSSTVSPSGSLAAAPGVTAAQKTPIVIPSGNYGTSAFSCGYYDFTKVNHSDSSGLYADEWARYMNQTDLYGSFSEIQTITTYTVGMLGPQCSPAYPALLKSMADNGGGKYFATSDYSEISTAILKILNEVQAVNSVFASASLPVSVNATGTYLNQIYLGMFRPDASGNPRWLGNLKQYKFILQYNDPANPNPNNATLTLGDANGNPALSSAGTGFLAPTAVSFWSNVDKTKAPDSTGGFFINDSKGVGGTYDSPDGELVEKGGVAQQTRSSYLTVDYNATPETPRKLYTYCPTGTGCVADLTDASNRFATTNTAITDAMLAAVAKVSVSSITRIGTTATVTTSGAHGFNNGDSVTISGADQADYNGTKNLIVTSGPTSNTFAFTVAENPPTPATGKYTASLPGQPLPVMSMTRATGSLTVNVTTGTGTTPINHGFVNGQWVAVKNTSTTVLPDESRYGTTGAQITVTGPSTFTYNVIEEGPAPIAGNGTATVSGGGTPVNILSATAKPSPGIQRPAPGQTDPLVVLVTTATRHGFAAGNTVTLSGVTDANGLSVSLYGLTTQVVSIIGQRNNSTSFTIKIPYTTPRSPATAGIYAVDGSADLTNITSLSRIGNEVTATFISTHKFVDGEVVDIGAQSGVVNPAIESAYTGPVNIYGVDATNTSFKYFVNTSPATPATGTITAWKAGVSDRGALINWLRGENNFGDEPQPGFGYTVRQSVHGDVLHSRPAVVNYGDGRGLVLFYGANDGVFRAVNGSQTAAIGSVQAGGELWGLILPQHYLQLNRQRVNSPELKFPSTVLPSARPKDYFIDGLTGSLVQYDANGVVSKAYIYITMRRGGRFIYALDVTTPTTPKVLWRIDAATTPGFAELGQTWSRPRMTLVKGYVDGNGKPKPVLVFGAGYDAAGEDAEPPTADTMGRGIYVVDAETGALVWRATSATDTSTCPTGASCASVTGMKWAIAADISVLDRDNDGVMDRLYAADLGGNVWRVDLETVTSGAPANWQVTKLAALGCASGVCGSGVSPRKFFFPPNVVSVGVTGGTGSYDAVMLGSGDREHPLASTNTSSSYFVTNRFYVLKDTKTGMDANAGSAWTPITEAALFDATSVNYNDTLSGYYVTFARGEKAVNASITTRGTTYFGTNRPIPQSPNSCSSNLGEAKSYALDPFTGGYTSTIFDGGGMPPSPVAGIVSMTLPNGEEFKQAFCIGCGGKTALSPVDPSKKVPKKPRRVYWYKK
jgi:type IV pilus assembly protein PilY1